jgi:hypothetical protein
MHEDLAAAVRTQNRDNPVEQHFSAHLLPRYLA